MPDRPLALAADAAPSVNDLISITLTRAGFRVVAVDDPEALAVAVTTAVRLVVLAATGFGESAAEFAAAIRGRAARPAVVLLANGEDPAADDLAAADPGVLVVHKPFRLTELVHAARQLVGSGGSPT
ncbi:MAG TPA: hypothetical protein VD866_30005 [Urbifossiella sp.]|nr:hypothetical protein [Urbifossiella sp.]